MLDNIYVDKVKTTAVKYNLMQQAILLYIEEQGVVIAESIIPALKIAKNTLSYNLNKLEKDGVIQTVQSSDQRIKPRKLTKYGTDVVKVLKGESLEDSNIEGHISVDLLSEDSLKAAISFLEGRSSAKMIDLDERERILRYVEKICYFAQLYRTRKK